MSLAAGVAQVSFRVTPVRLSCAFGWFPQHSESSARGVGQILICWVRLLVAIGLS
jgi:hypothetical protein